MIRRAMWIAAVASVAVIAAAQAAKAQSPGFYVSGAVGTAKPVDADYTGTGINSSVESDFGYAFAAAFGYAYTSNLRSELELAYSSADVSSVTNTPSPTGDISALRGMVNGYFDFHNSTQFTPYIGVGIGAARINADNIGTIGGSVVDDSDVVFAYQGIVGLNYALDDHFSVFGDYRYFATLDPGFSTNAGTSIDAEYGEHRIMIGLRYSFGAPPKPMAKPMPVSQPTPPKVTPPPPPPPPPPAPKVQAPPEVPRTYLVFFDWDKSDLKPEALAIIKTAFENSKKAKMTRIDTTGHADRSGPDAYNMGLSRRRAQAVAEELIRLGVNPAAIVLDYKGEREPLVQTPDGVREPQNRRVEIVLER